MKGFKEAKQVIDVLGTVKKSPYCQQRTAEITAYVKASLEEKKALDWMATQDATATESLPKK